MTITKVIRGGECGRGGEHAQPLGAPSPPHAQVIRAAQGETSQAIFRAEEKSAGRGSYEPKQRLLTLLDHPHIEIDKGNKGGD